MSYKRKRVDDNPVAFKFRTEKQEIAWETIESNDITFLVGPAGTAKTFIATAYALDSLYAGRTHKITMTRPVVEAGEKLGFLPGDIEGKLKPFMRPIDDSSDKIVGSDNSKKLKEDKSLEIVTLAHMRGRTLDKSVCLLDEAQNATIEQIEMFMTRIGKDSKLIITGDPYQTDIGRQCHLMEIVDCIRDVDGVGVVEFDESDIQRHRIIGPIVRRVNALKEQLRSQASSFSRERAY